MTDKTEDAIRRGIRAKAIAEDPIFKEASDHIEAECWRLFKTFAPGDIEGLTQVKAMQYMHEKYQAFLRKAMQDGQMAKLDVERKQVRPSGY